MNRLLVGLGLAMLVGSAPAFAAVIAAFAVSVAEPRRRG